MHRYKLIIKKLKTKPYSSYEELSSYINHQMDYLQIQDENLNMAFSRRTLQRDIQEIRSLWGLDIEYSKQNRGYFIANELANNANTERMMEAFDLFNALNISQDISPFIHLENRQPQGTENLYGLIHAIKNKQQIKFSSHKYRQEKISYRTVEPYALKEFKNRWYLIAKDTWSDSVKTYALDRLFELEITNQKFTQTSIYNVEENFRYCFGIISPNEEEPKDIVLSFNNFQGKYIKSLPLHHTQTIVLDNEEELQIKLKLCITHDFVMELLSFGNNVKVVQPQILKDEIKVALAKALKQYK